MADYIVTSGELTTVANAIREKNGTSSNLSWPDGFVSGISSGGGGSSDFSTAEVTIISSENVGFLDGLVTLDNTFGILNTAGVERGTEIINVPLYKGHLTWFQDSTGITLSGNAQVLTGEHGDYIDITGDCTITIS